VEQPNNVYWELVGITNRYLGPATERFIDRQVQNHLNKDSKDITKKDVGELTDWIRGAVSLLTDNEKLVEEYIDQLRLLSQGQRNPSIKRQ
jgi:hypothetical protein